MPNAVVDSGDIKVSKVCSHFLLGVFSSSSQEACSLGHMRLCTLEKHAVNSKTLDQGDLGIKSSVV